MLPIQKAEASSQIFTDVPKSHPNYAAIMYLADQGVITKQKRFGPNDKVTREEVAIMVAKATGLNGTKTKTKFKDVPASRYSSGYINSAANARIINGYPDGTFKPTQYVTRGHMAAFIANAFKLTKEKDVYFSDVKKGSTSYNAVRKLAFENITSGFPDGTFKPNQTLTRSHIAAFIARAMNPSFKPRIRESVIRNVYFGMSPQQVEQIETATLITKGKVEGDYALAYKVKSENFFSNSVLWYFFINNELNMINFDFFYEKNKYLSWSSLESMYNDKVISLRKQLGNEDISNQYSDSYPKLSKIWHKKEYNVMIYAENKKHTELSITYYDSTKY